MKALKVTDLGPIEQGLADITAQKHLGAQAGIPYTRPRYALENFEFLEFDGVKVICLVDKGRIFGTYALHPVTGELILPPWLRLPGEITDFVSRKFWQKHDPDSVKKFDDFRKGEHR